MNVFYLSSDSYMAARFQCDRHLHTSFRDVLILLSSVIQSNATVKKIYSKQSKNWPGELFSPCESTNRWFIWAKKNPANFNWLAHHADGITYELESRGLMPPAQKRGLINRQILTSNFIEFAKFAMASNQAEISEPPQVMPEAFQVSRIETYETVVGTYRNYYMAKMTQALHTDNPYVWTNRGIPDWMETIDTRNLPKLPPRFHAPSSIRAFNYNLG